MTVEIQRTTLWHLRLHHHGRNRMVHGEQREQHMVNMHFSPFSLAVCPLYIPGFSGASACTAATRRCVCAHALRAPPSPAASSAGWPLTPHAGSTRVTFPPPSETPRVCSCRALLTCTPSALFLPGLACAMSGIGSIPGAAGGNPVVFFDISIGGHSAGRIKMEVGCDPRP